MEREEILDFDLAALEHHLFLQMNFMIKQSSNREGETLNSDIRCIQLPNQCSLYNMPNNAPNFLVGLRVVDLMHSSLDVGIISTHRTIREMRNRSEIDRNRKVTT